MAKKLYSIQMLRGWAALAVVLYHCRIIEKKYSGGDFILPDFFRIGQSGVDLFFVISGFVMVTITIKKWGGGIFSGTFLLHRAARIYPNYWVYFFLTIMVFIIRPGYVNASEGNRFDFLSSFLLLPSNTLPLVLVAWSLVYEIYFYLVFALLIRLRKREVISLLLFWLVVLCAINLLVPVPANPVIQLITSPYSIEFIMGALGAVLLDNRRIFWVPSWVFIFVIIGLTLMMPYLFFKYYSHDIAGLFVQSVIFGLYFSLFVVCGCMIEKKVNMPFPALAVKIGDASYTIYLSHVLLLGAMGRLWATSFQSPLSTWDNWLVFPVMLSVVVIYSLVASKILEYPLYHAILKLLTSKRSREKQNA